MSLKELFDLNDNPFRMTPGIKPEEIIWAGFSDLKNNLKNRIQRSMRISGSSLILNWGEYGSGKTHAARYFNRKDVLLEIAGGKEHPIPFSLWITLPTSKQPISDLFVSIIDLIDIDKIREEFKDIPKEIEQFIESFSRNLFIQNILKAFFDVGTKSISLKKYLYGTISTKEFNELSNEKHGILRKLETDDDRIKILSGLFSCLTYEKKIYSNIVIWIDEFENISHLNINNTESTNKFIRDLLDYTPNHLLIFLNITLAAFLSYEDLGSYISPAVISRIRDRINFEIPDIQELKTYLMELLNDKLYREGKHKNPYHPFTEEAIDFVVGKLESVSLRRYNDAFSMLLELAEFDNEKTISGEFAAKYESDIIGWRGNEQ